MFSVIPRFNKSTWHDVLWSRSFKSRVIDCYVTGTKLINAARKGAITPGRFCITNTHIVEKKTNISFELEYLLISITDFFLHHNSSIMSHDPHSDILTLYNNK